MPPPWVPTIGFSNITDPTPFPPPPLVLDPLRDYQPLETALGEAVFRQFREVPTATPPPDQAALDLFAACPDMSGMGTSSEVRVTVPKCLGSMATRQLRSGIWIGPQGEADKPTLDMVYASYTEDAFQITSGPSLSFNVGGMLLGRDGVKVTIFKHRKKL